MAVYTCEIVTEKGSYTVKTRATMSSHAKLNAIKYIEERENDKSPIIKATAKEIKLPIDYNKCFFLKRVELNSIEDLLIDFIYGSKVE